MKNLYEWRYIFYYQPEENSGDKYYTDITTDRGFKYAQNVAWGRCTFDGCKHLVYVTRRKV